MVPAQVAGLGLRLPATGASGAGATDLLEREAELACIDRVFERAEAGAGAAVVVGGPAGIGKSELLSAVRAGAQARDFGVLAARGSEFEQEIAFGIARQLFEPMLRTAAPRERRRLLEGVAQMGAQALGLNEGQPPADRFAVTHGLFWLCANRADRGPLLVLVDDVQWADDPSLAWLGYLHRRLGDLPLCLVLGLRSGEPGAERPEIQELFDAGGVHRLAPAPLSRAAVGTIVRGQLGQDAGHRFCATCSDLTGGNPLFVRELLAAVRDEGLAAHDGNVPALQLIAPAAVGTSILTRLGRLGTAAMALARAVAILGPGTEVRLAGRLADLDPVVAESAADRLAAARILAPGRPLEFFHPLIGTAILEDIAPGARRIAHRRAASLVDGDHEGSPARVAVHLLACIPAGDGWVVGRLRDAALQALQRGAPEVAADYLRRALVEPPAAGERAKLLSLLGTAAWRAGQPDAIPLLEQALAEAGEDLPALLLAVTLLSRAYVVNDHVDRTVDMLEQALPAVGALDPDAALRIQAGIAITGLFDERTAADALRRADGLYRLVSSLADPPVQLLVSLVPYAVRTNRVEVADELVDRVLASEPSSTTLDDRNVLITTLAFIERYESLLLLCEDQLAAARESAAIEDTVISLAARAGTFCDCGNLAEAEADARWVLEHGKGFYRMQAASDLTRVLIERDMIDQAEDTLLQVADPHASRLIEATRLLISRGRLRAVQGRFHEALDDLLEAGGRCGRLGLSKLPSLPWRSEAALVHATLGNTRDAQRLAKEQLDLARAFGRPRALGISLRACGLVNRGEAGLELLAEAVTVLEASRSPVELARALTDHGAALRRAGRRIQARAQLERALDLAHRAGARRIATQARAELIAAGARPRRDAITGRDALTVGELRVSRLAAEGLSNREIAQALFITTATAKAHLNRVFRKLEISQRAQLTDALAAVVGE